MLNLENPHMHMAEAYRMASNYAWAKRDRLKEIVYDALHAHHRKLAEGWDTAVRNVDWLCQGAQEVVALRQRK